MERQEFIDIRNKLERTQKELAELLGISLKTVCSYEQGWRKIPCHIERLLFFLLARKKGLLGKPKNCWDIRNCPPETREKCPVWEFDSGQFCWFINATFCKDSLQKNLQEKSQLCKHCQVFKKIRE